TLDEPAVMRTKRTSCAWTDASENDWFGCPNAPRDRRREPSALTSTTADASAGSAAQIVKSGRPPPCARISAQRKPTSSVSPAASVKAWPSVGPRTGAAAQPEGIAPQAPRSLVHAWVTAPSVYATTTSAHPA